MANLKALEKQLISINKERIRVQEEIMELKIQEALPAIKKKYEGRYWKYKNSCGGDDWWWLYSYCIEAQDDRGGLFNVFQKTPYAYEFKVRAEEYFHLCAIEISKDEYNEALSAFKRNVNEL